MNKLAAIALLGIVLGSVGLSAPRSAHAMRKNPFKEKWCGDTLACLNLEIPECTTMTDEEWMDMLEWYEKYCG